MKKHISKLLALVAFAILLVGAGQTQDGGRAVRANIPFKFYAGSKLMPAGEYLISVNAMNRVVLIGDEVSGSRALVLGSPDEKSRSERTVLRFKLVGDEVYALSEFQGPELGVSFTTKRSERALSVQNHSSDTEVIVAAM